MDDKKNRMNLKIQWKWVIGITIAFIIFLMVVLPQISNYSNKVVGQSQAPDQLLFYSAADLYTIAEDYGAEGRENYIKLRWTFDVVWPFVYTLFLVLWMIKLLEYMPAKKAFRTILILPILSLFFDFMENIGATIVMYRYPLESGVIATITPIMTLIKWAMIAGSFVMLMALIILFVISKLKKER